MTRPRIIGTIPAKMKRSRSSNFRERGPMVAKQRPACLFRGKHLALNYNTIKLSCQITCHLHIAEV
jgi:hypothetical protein